MRSWLVLALLLVAFEARADLLADGAKLEATWRQSGVQTARTTTVFLMGGESRSVTIPRAASAATCTTIVALAERHIEFSLTEVPAATLGAKPKAAQKSSAGVARIDSCGKVTPARVVVTMTSTRGTIDVFVARDARPPPEVELTLPKRAVGPVAPRGDPGVPLPVASVADRKERSERGARLDGARTVVRVATRASSSGTGAMLLKLSDGCHRLVVIAERERDDQRLDVDADVRHHGRDSAIALDRSHAPDARLDFCIGEDATVELRFAGVDAPAPVVVLDAHWPALAAIPAHWGPSARAALGWAIHRRRSPTLTGPPQQDFIGSGGVTFMPVAVEPQTCYLAAFGVVRGDVSAARISAEVGGRVHYDDATDTTRGAAVTFCSGAERHALLKLDVRSRLAWWRLALWPLGGTP